MLKSIRHIIHWCGDRIHDYIWLSLVSWYWWTFKPPRLPSYVRLSDLPELPSDLHKSNHGIAYDGYRACQRTGDTVFRHFALIGQTGGGKTSVFIAYMLRRRNRRRKNKWSWIIVDPSGEIREATSGFKSKTHDIFTVDFSNPRSSSYINPLYETQTPSERYKLADLVIKISQGAEPKGDPFWAQSATNAVFIFMEILDELGKEYCSMSNVKVLIELMLSSPKSVDQIVVNLSDDLYRKYSAFIGTNQRTLSSILMSAKVALLFLLDPNVDTIFSAHNIDINALRTRPCVLYINTKVTESIHRAPTALIMEAIMSRMLYSIPKGGLPVTILYEELPSLPSPTVPILVACGRKYKISVVYIAQSWSALYKAFGSEVEAIKANTHTTLAYGGMPLNEARELSEYFGSTTYLNANGQERRDKTMSSDFIHQLNQPYGILSHGTHPPVIVRTRPFFVQKILKRRSQIPPYAPRQQAPTNATKPIVELINTVNRQ